MPDLKCYTDSAWNWFDCSVQDLVGATGGWGLFGVLIAGVIVYASWEISPTRSLALPAALTTLVGGLFVPILPGNIKKVAWAVFFLGIVIGVFAVGEKFVISGKQ